MPPYGEDTPPNLFAPYGLYADAFAFTVDVRVEGRSGIAGAPDAEVDDIEEGRGLETVDDPVAKAILFIAVSFCFSGM